MSKLNYIFETSWEVCNKVGGIHTVVSTKAISLQKQIKDHLIMLGPDLHRDEEKNPEFEEDNTLFQKWTKKTIKEGLKIKTGRWKIVGKPIVILIDFSPFIAEKNQIFKHFWELYKLDSLSGQWDYIEPAIFGYATAKVIESFYNFYLGSQDKVLAHFHEWMTGTGILYLKDKTPAIATAFTTHATTVGRSIAGNGQALYSKLASYNGEAKAREFNIVSKQSLEKISAQQADVYTTVSEITAEECKQFHQKEPDIITPNGFEDDFVPNGNEFDKKRNNARACLRKVSETLFGYKLPEKVNFVVTSGRYEFSNKGIDVFIDALGKLMSSNIKSETTLAFILVPANNYGARKDLQESLKNNKLGVSEDNRILTHYLHDADYDPVLNKIAENKIQNLEKDKIKVIFAPVYLNGNDGIFNLSYWDLLIGFDLSVFPSYYEPWGYTPLESLAFHIPTVTTTLSGFGRWVLNEGVKLSKCLKVIERNDDNYDYVVDKIAETISICSTANEKFLLDAQKNAFDVSRIALWKNFIKYYFKAYDIALDKSKQRRKKVIPHETKLTSIVTHKSNKPVWRHIRVSSKVPEAFAELEKLANNLWWSWSFDAQNLFQYINPERWLKLDKNPIALLHCISYERFKELKNDDYFNILYRKVIQEFNNYLNRPFNKDLPSIAYFSMEYGISNVLKIYSGGLGILAGDYLKQASDSNIDMVAIGLLYKYGYFRQVLSMNGEQQVVYKEQNFAQMPIKRVQDENGKPVLIELALPGRIVKIQIWQVSIGKVQLFLLDTDIPENQKEDRVLTGHLYGGDNDYRLKQELILGVGGIRALNKLNIYKDVYHLNEGHAAFAGIERINQLINKEKLGFAESLEIVKASSLFTTHTPVPAGHDTFSEDELLPYLGHYPERLKTTWENLMDLGRARAGNIKENFSMSYLASHLSQEINGVSKLHAEVTKKMFNKLWEGYFPEESHISYVTNGVHMPSWAAENWLNLYKNLFKDKFINQQSSPELWSKLDEIDDLLIWEYRKANKKALFDYIKEYLNEKGTRLFENPKYVTTVREELNEKYLTIGFARRFATYKRGNLLLKDINRLKKLLNNTDKPLRFIFAGKAHPNDKAGQSIIKEIVHLSKQKDFIGRIIFIENYDIEVAKKLVQGVDIWLNTPTRPLEASGTSGMKAVMNGVLNLSVLDGWWLEGYRQGAGWALSEKRSYDNQEFQDQLDVETIYNLLENEIIPMYYERNKQGYPEQWIQMIRKNIKEIAPEFSTKRMLDDYMSRFYKKLLARKNEVNANNYLLAKELSLWKKRAIVAWEQIKAEEVQISEAIKGSIEIGQKYHGKIILKYNDSLNIDIGVEIVISEQSDEELKILDVIPMKLHEKKNGKAHFSAHFIPSKPGNFNFGIRVYLKHPKLLYRQDFSYLKWI